jgi:hypothetical protein
MIFKGDLAVYSTSTKFTVPAQSVADETDYSGIKGAGNGNWVLGSALLGHKVILVLNTGAAANSPTGVTVGLASASDANGTGAAFVSGKSTEYTTALDLNVRTYELTLSGLTTTSYYSPAVAVKGGGTATLLCAVSALFPDPPHV